MRRLNVTASKSLRKKARAQIKFRSDREFSAALLEYGVKPKDVERSAQRELAAIRQDRKAGKLKRWKPGL
jgi:hypothetical protein